MRRRAVVITLAMVLLGLASLRALVRAPASLNHPRPVTDLVGEPSRPPVTPPRRALMVLIDGLRADMAWQLPFLDRLAAAGASADLWIDPPTYSSAQYVAFLTGVAPRDSGVRTNVGAARVALDNLPRRLAAAGRTSREIGDEVDWWGRLFGADFTSTRLVAPAELPAAATEAMAASDLTLVHLCSVDRMGHRHGAASPEYAAAARDQDRTLERLALAFGWPSAPVVVLSDHGHMPRGGHGGDEPDARHSFLVVSGAGARAHAPRTQASSVDVAPTLAALLGVAAPANAQGRTLAAMLDVDAATGAALAAADGERVARARRAAAEGWRRHQDGATWPRLARAALLACLLLLGWAAARSAPPGTGAHVRAGLAGGVAALAVGVAAYLVSHHRVSFSAGRDTPHLALGAAVLGTIAAAIGLAPTIAGVVRRGLSPEGAAARGLSAAVAGAPAAALVFVAFGAEAPRLGCEPAWLAAGPLVAYALFTPLPLMGALVASLAGLVGTRGRGRG